jgi:hypothetical protein
MPPNRADFRVKTRAGRRQHIRVNGLAGQLGRFPVTSGRYNLQTPFDRHLIGSATREGEVPYFDFAPGERVLRKFIVFGDSNGRSVAAEAHGLPGGVFGSRDEALCSALWQSMAIQAGFTLRRPATPRPA